MDIEPDDPYAPPNVPPVPSIDGGAAHPRARQVFVETDSTANYWLTYAERIPESNRVIFVSKRQPPLSSHGSRLGITAPGAIKFGGAEVPIFYYSVRVAERRGDGVFFAYLAENLETHPTQAHLTGLVERARRNGLTLGRDRSISHVMSEAALEGNPIRMDRDAT